MLNLTMENWQPCVYRGLMYFALWQENLWSVQLDNLWTDEKVKEKEGSEPVCCICGCEDNEDLEALVLATCPGLMETWKIAC
jgi:hypothetical protein